MEHKEIKMIREGAEGAVLFIHGIIGTPNHFRRFLPLVPENMSVYNLLLDGHGKGVTDFSKTSMMKWKAQVVSAVEELAATHKDIYIVAHSMGCLLAIEQAVNNSAIKGLFLLAVPIKIWMHPKMIGLSMKICFDKVDEKDPVAVAARDCCGIQHEKNLFKYLGWIPRFLELFTAARQTKKLLPQLDIPCLVYQSQKDEVVSKRTTKYLKDRSSATVVELENSTHYFYDTQDMEKLQGDFKRFVMK